MYRLDGFKLVIGNLIIHLKIQKHLYNIVNGELIILRYFSKYIIVHIFSVIININEVIVFIE